MPRRLPPLNSLRAFEAAARHLSFTKAAEELFVTQAAISHQIKALEDYLGVELFIRRNRKLLLTDEGQLYWPKIRDIFEKLVNATEQVKAQGATGSLTVSVIPTFATLWLVPRLAEFSQLYPEIDVRIKASDTEVDFVREDVDIAVYYGKGEYDGLHCDQLFQEHLTPVCSPGLAQSGTLNTPQDLANHTLLHDATTEEWRTWIKHADVKGVNPDQGPVFSHSGMVLQAARHGQGVAMGHSVLSQMDLDSARLVAPFDIVVDSGHSYDLVCPENSHDRPKIVAFREWLLSKVNEDVDDEILY
ncbi:transcriptional regulator GcvA [Kangiella shandongensis]|uniref:transcriptional regulator GcvA n=1 Tax=Kangiella shandongensis TaxID=2763258 RepID=UPI001CBCF241|nr:transcriptional regulator GcvA [Kangiella shandongensis]